MKNGWRLMTLADACQMKPPKSEARAKLSADSEVSFLPMEDLGVESRIAMATQTRPLAAVVGSYTYFADGDILLAKITPCFENGKLGIASGLANGIGFGSSEYHVLRPTSAVTKEWLYYFLSRESFREEGAARMTGAVGHRRVPKEFIEECTIPVPPLAEQERVVGILDEAFDGIATAKANADQSLKNSRALFESHLFDVFEGAKGGWRSAQLGDVCEFEGGSQPPKAEFVHTPRDGYIRFLQIRDFGSDKHVTFIPESKRNRICRADDILIGRYGASVGKVLTGMAGAYNVALMKATPDSDRLDRRFFYYYLRSGAFQDRLNRVASRSAQDGFGKEDIYGFPVPVPTLAEQRAVVLRLEAFATETSRLGKVYECKLNALHAMKRSLLSRAFTGQL